MPTLTPNYNLNKPNVNSADDEDLWGGQLNENFDTIDTQLKTNADNAAKASPVTDTKTGDYTVVAADFGKTILVDATSGNVTITFPDPATVGSGFRFGVKKIDSSTNTVTSDGNGADTIDGATTSVLTEQYDAEMYSTDGSNWFITAEYDVPAAEQKGILLTQASGTSIPSDTWTTVNWDTEEFDDFGWHSGSSSDVTVDFDGYALVNATCAADTTANGSPGVRVLKNGTQILTSSFTSVTSAAAIGNPPGSSPMGIPQVFGVIPVSNGDVLTVQVWRNGGGTNSTDTDSAQFFVEKYKET